MRGIREATHLPLLPEVGEGSGDAALILRHSSDRRRRRPDGDHMRRAAERDPPRGRGAPPGPRCGGERRRPGGGGLERERHGGGWVVAGWPAQGCLTCATRALGGIEEGGAACEVW